MASPSVSRRTRSAGSDTRKRLRSIPVPPMRERSVDLLLAPADARVDEAVEVAVEDGARVADLVLRAQVLHHLVRGEHVRADLVAPARSDVAGQLFLLRVLLLLLEQQQSGREHAHGRGAV